MVLAVLSKSEARVTDNGSRKPSILVMCLLHNSGVNQDAATSGSHP